MQLCLWGRSMGAAAAIRYSTKNENPNIRACVLDSPFSSLKELAILVGVEKTKLPKLLVELILEYVTPIIAEKAKFNINQLNLLADVTNGGVPAVFIASQKDSLVPYQQVQGLYSNYKSSDKQIFLIEQDHNEPRSKQTIADIFKSVNKYMSRPASDRYFSQNNDQNVQSKSKIKIQLTLKSTSQRDLLAFRSEKHFQRCEIANDPSQNKSAYEGKENQEIGTKKTLLKANTVTLRPKVLKRLNQSSNNTHVRQATLNLFQNRRKELHHHQSLFRLEDSSKMNELPAQKAERALQPSKQNTKAENRLKNLLIRDDRSMNNKHQLSHEQFDCCGGGEDTVLKLGKYESEKINSSNIISNGRQSEFVPRSRNTIHHLIKPPSVYAQSKKIARISFTKSTTTTSTTKNTTMIPGDKMYRC